MPLLPFVAGSLAGRGGRFFLVAALIRLGGEPLARRLRDYIDLLGWLALLAAVVVFAVYKLLGNGA